MTGVDADSVSSSLRKELSAYVDDSYDHLGSCVLWFKSLNDQKSKLSKILESHNIIPKYLKFSIIICASSVLFTRDYGCPTVLFYEDLKYKPDKSSISCVNAYSY